MLIKVTVTKEMVDYLSNFNPLDNMDTDNDDVDQNRCNTIIMNTVTYISSYVCCKLLKIHKCETC